MDLLILKMLLYIQAVLKYALTVAKTRARFSVFCFKAVWPYFSITHRFQLK